MTTLETIFHGERLQRDKVSVDTVSTAVASLPLSQPELGLMSVSPLTHHLFLKLLRHLNQSWDISRDVLFVQNIRFFFSLISEKLIFTKMPSEEAITELIEDKFVTVKEELEEIIDEVKNDVDEKAVQISNNKRSQEQSFEQLHIAMNKLRKDLKQLGN